jgi:Clp protease
VNAHQPISFFLSNDLFFCQQGKVVPYARNASITHGLVFEPIQRHYIFRSATPVHRNSRAMSMSMSGLATQLAIASVLTLLTAPGANASIWLSESGTTAYLKGNIEKGDDAIFRAFLDKPRERPLKTLVLSSPGGHVDAGLAIGEMIRNAKLATLVDADSSACSSACTFAFAGGVRRHYVNGDKVWEGTTSMVGLGFHPARIVGSAIQPSVYSRVGVERMQKFYARMGMPGAGALMDRAAINTMFRPNGQTALRLKIATTLQPPKD